MTANPTTNEAGILPPQHEDPSHFLLMQDVEEAAELMASPAPVLEMETPEERDTREPAVASAPHQAGRATSTITTVQPERWEELVPPTAATKTPPVLGPHPSSTTNIIGAGGDAGQEPRQVGGVAAAASEKDPNSIPDATAGRVPDPAPPAHYYPAYGAPQPYYYGPTPHSPFMGNPEKEKPGDQGSNNHTDEPPAAYPYHYPPYGYPYYAYPPYPTPQSGALGGAAATAGRPSVTPSSSARRPSAAPAPWSPPKKYGSSKKQSPAAGHYHPSPYPFSPSAGGYFHPMYHSYNSHHPPSFDKWLQSSDLTTSGTTAILEASTKSTDSGEAATATATKTKGETKPKGNEKLGGTEEPQTPTRTDSADAESDEEVLMLSPLKPGWLSPYPNGNFGIYPPPASYPYYPYPPTGPSFYDYPPPPPDVHAGAPPPSYYVGEEPSQSFTIGPQTPGAPPTTTSSATTSRRGSRGRKMKLEKNASTASSTGDDDSHIMHQRATKNINARKRAAAFRQKLEEIAGKLPHERTDEEKGLLKQNEGRRTSKNMRSRNRAMENKNEMERIMATPASKRTALDVAFLEEQSAAKQRKLEGDKLRRQRMKELGLTSKKDGSAAGIRISARGPLPPEYQALIAQKRQQETLSV